MVGFSMLPTGRKVVFFYFFDVTLWVLSPAPSAKSAGILAVAVVVLPACRLSSKGRASVAITWCLEKYISRPRQLMQLFSLSLPLYPGAMAEMAGLPPRPMGKDFLSSGSSQVSSSRFSWPLNCLLHCDSKWPTSDDGVQAFRPRKPKNKRSVCSL